MFRFLTPLAFCVLAFCVQGADGQPAVNAKAPKLIFLSGLTNGMGKIKSYGKQSVPFRFKNGGEAPLELVRFTPTCSCVSASADKRLLQPQEEAVVTVVLDASMVHGVFKRSLWVETSDPAWRRFSLSLIGEVLPLFTGLPASQQQLVIPEGAACTNRFTLTPCETGVFLGTPAIIADTNKLLAAANVVTNLTGGVTSYEVSLVLTGRTSGRHSVTLAIPVEGRPNLHPLKVNYYARVGSELKAIPSKVMLFNSDQPLTRRLHLMADKSLPTNAITWTPQRQGVSVAVRPSARNSLMMVTLTLAPEAVASLMKEPNAEMSFHCPNYKPATVSFLFRPQPAAATNGAAQAPAK